MRALLNLRSCCPDRLTSYWCTWFIFFYNSFMNPISKIGLVWGGRGWRLPRSKFICQLPLHWVAVRFIEGVTFWSCIDAWFWGDRWHRFACTAGFLWVMPVYLSAWYSHARFARSFCQSWHCFCFPLDCVGYCMCWVHLDIFYSSDA